MRIICPQCGYSRDIPAETIPAGSSMATCPKCRFRFRFRGHQASSRPEEVLEEPVYPPRPSRPAVEPRSGSGAAAPVSFEPAQHVYMPESDPGLEPEHHGHVPPRPQARWLPDPEPGSSRPQAPARAEPTASGTSGEPAVPAPVAPGGADPAETERSWGRPEARPRFEPVFEPVVEPGEEPVAGPVIERPAPIQSAEAARPDAGHAGEQGDPPPETGEAAQEVQPSEAVAGEDSVRDIWARLQAMGGETKAVPAGARQQEDESQSPSAPPIPPDIVAPWEQLEHYGVVPAFLNTVKNILLRPGDFFDQLSPFAGKLRPLLFALGLCVAAMLFGLAWNYFGLGPNFSELGRTDGFQGLGSGAIGSLALLGLSPIVLIGFAFLDSALVHLLLGLVRAATKPFEETFRTICYAGAPWILTVLPVPWSYLIPVVLIWQMTLQAIGLKKLHQAGYPQVLASVLVKWSLYFMASFAILHVLITRG